MKKLIALVLCLIMVTSLLGCDGAATPDGTDGTGSADATGTQAALSAGFAKEDITPKNSVPLSGTQEQTMSEGILANVYVSCVAIADAEGDTLLFFTLDSQAETLTVFNKIKKYVSKETGIPVENIQFSYTHTHYSVPALTYGSYGAQVEEAAIKAGVDAVADLAPAQMYIAKGRTEKLNFVRHYETADGKFIGDNYGIHSTATIVGHETEADNELRLIQFVREGDKKDIVMMNWQAHPNQSGGTHLISADYVGFCRDKIAEEMDCLVAYYQGAAGNVNPRSYIADENLTPKVDIRAHGEALAKYAIQALKDNKQQVEGGDIQIKIETHTAKVRKVDPEFAAQVPTFISVFESTGNRQEACKATGEIVNSIYAVRKMEQLSNYGETYDIEVRAISVGDVAFITAPYEMFDTNGMYVRENSPFDMTFVLAYCNNGLGYIPSALAYEHGCYEEDNSTFAAGTGEELANLYVDMLKELHGE